MGPAHVPDALRAGRFAAVAAVVLCCAGAPAQAPLDRGFERVFFVQREAWLDELFTRASPERRREVAPLLRDAVRRRGWANSLAGQRCIDLAKAAAALTGRDEARTLDRFNWFLLALPEVVDPEKTDGDRVKLGEITRRVYPLLKPVVADDPTKIVQDADKISLTARGVFGFDKPEKLRVRFRVTTPGGDEVAKVERGDSQRDPRGWLVFDLYSSISVAGRDPGPMLGHAEIGVAGSWPAGDAPPLAKRFHLAPGFHERVWELLSLRSGIDGQERRPLPRDLARLDVLIDEVTRVLLGKSYVFRSWPIEALNEAMALARALRDHKREPVPAKGDRVFGIRAAPQDDTRLFPVRTFWGRRTVKHRRGLILLPPSGCDQDWLTGGLGIDPAELQRDDLVIACTTFPVAPNYLAGVQRLLAQEFGVDPTRTTVVGALDGATRARYALGVMKTPLRELVFAGNELPDPGLLGSHDVARVHVVPVYGHPEQKRIDAIAAVLRDHGLEDRVRLEKVGPRSMIEALRTVLRQR